MISAKDIDAIEIVRRLLLKCTDCAKEYTGGKDVHVEIRAALLEDEIKRLKDVQTSMLKQAQIEALEWAAKQCDEHESKCHVAFIDGTCSGHPDLLLCEEVIGKAISDKIKELKGDK